MLIDKYGCLSQVQPDGSLEGGDSACWTGHLCYLTPYVFPYVDFFELAPGAWVRHPKLDQTNNGFGAYYMHAWDGVMSRDQLTGVVAGIISAKDQKAALRLVLHHALRGFLFAYNTRKNGAVPRDTPWQVPDLTLFDFWAIELRMFGKKSWLFWPVLCVLDLHTLMGVMYEPFSKDIDVINLLMKVFISTDQVQTPTSWLAKKLVDKGDMITKVTKYWDSWRKQPEMVEHYVERIKDF